MTDIFQVDRLENLFFLLVFLFSALRIDAFIVLRIKSRYVAGFVHAHLLVEKNVE